MNDNKKDLLIIGGMRFSDINACAHRMIGIAKMFKPFCERIFLLGVGESIENGDIADCKYKTIIYPKTAKQFWNFTFSAKEYITFLKANKSIKYVVVNGSVPSVPTMKIAKFCRKNGIDFIFDIGEWYSNPYKFIKGLIKGFDIFLKMHVVCKKYQNYIVSSSYLASHCGSKKNVLIFPTMVTMPIDNKRKQKKFNGVVKLSFIGFLEKKNKKENLDPLIESIVSFNNNHKTKFDLSIIGTDGNSSENIHFYGKKTYKECIQYLVDSDFSVIPRGKTRKNQSGFPTKLSESFLYNVPVISTDTSDIKNYILDGENGFILGENTVESFTSCFEKISEELSLDSEYLNKLSSNIEKTNKLQPEFFQQSFKSFVDALRK